MHDDSQDYLAIMRLQRSYADIATRAAWKEVASLATPDARFSFDTHSGTVFEMNGPVAFGEFGARMTKSFTFYEYIPLNFVVTIGPDGTAEGRSFSLEVAEDGETGDWVDSTASTGTSTSCSRAHGGSPSATIGRTGAGPAGASRRRVGGSSPVGRHTPQLVVHAWV